MIDVEVIAIWLPSQRLFAWNRNQLNVCHGTRADIWLEFHTAPYCARNGLCKGAKNEQICCWELRNILSQSRSKPIFAGFKAKSRSLERRSHKKQKVQMCGWSCVVHSSVPETRYLRVHRFPRIPFGNWTKYCLEVGTDTFSLRCLWNLRDIEVYLS